MNSKEYIDKGSVFIAEEIAKQRGTPLSPEALLLMEYLKVSLNKELIDSQKKYQDDSVEQMKGLVKATWWLVVGTWALVGVTLLVVLLKH